MRQVILSIFRSASGTRFAAFEGRPTDDSLCCKPGVTVLNASELRMIAGGEVDLPKGGWSPTSSSSTGI